MYHWVSDTFSPWTDVDWFGQAKIRDALDPDGTGCTNVQTVSASRNGSEVQSPKSIRTSKPKSVPSRLLSAGEWSQSARNLLVSSPVVVRNNCTHCTFGILICELRNVESVLPLYCKS